MRALATRSTTTRSARSWDPADLLAVLLDAPTSVEGGRSVRVCLLVADDERLTTFLAGVVGALRAGSPTPGGATPEPVEPAPGVRTAIGQDEPAGVPSEPAPARADLSELTPRELDVLDLVARGEDNATIARRLGLSTRTVRNHLNSVFSKLNVTYRPQAVVLAREAGLGRGAPRCEGRSGATPR